MRAVQPYFWTVDWRFPTQTLGGHWEMKTPLREATRSTEVMAVALLLLCCHRVMFASLKGDFTLSKPTARLHVQLVMLISTVCSVQDRSQTSIKHCQATSSRTGEIVFLPARRCTDVCWRRVTTLSDCNIRFADSDSSKFNSCFKALECVSGGGAVKEPTEPFCLELTQKQI